MVDMAGFWGRGSGASSNRIGRLRAGAFHHWRLRPLEKPAHHAARAEAPLRPGRDGRGTAPFAFQVDLAVVIALEPGPMRDVDDRRVRDSIAQELHHLRLAEFVESGGRLVHDDEVRLLQDDTGESEAL